MSGLILAQAAESLVGCRFRLHGRDPTTGLDCIGVLFAALAAIGREPDFPSGYSLRTQRFSGLPELAARHGFVRAIDSIQPGDVMFTRPGPAQLHLVIAAVQPKHFVEAHAGLGRVVLSTGALSDPVLQSWRLHAHD